MTSTSMACGEHVIASEPGERFIGMTLRYLYEVRDEEPYFEDNADLKLPHGGCCKSHRQ